MAAPLKLSPFHAPIVRFSADQSGSRRALLGWCVTAHVTPTKERPRSWWANELAVGRSYLTEMTVAPTSTILMKLDTVLRKHPGPEHLQPRLLQLFAVIMPGDIGRDLAGWMATYFDMLDARDREVASSLPHLLRSEVVIARCQQTPPQVDLFSNKHIRACVNTLLLLGSGPYACSVTAIQRCADLGLLAPGPFFDEIERHLFDSAVGFRTIRTLERIAHIWRHRALASRIAPLTSDYFRSRFVDLLRALAKGSRDNRLVDPYPGAEWGITLARERLEDDPGSGTAKDWLEWTALDQERSARERLYAALICLTAGTLTAEILDSFTASNSRLLGEWAELFKGLDKDLDDSNLALEGRFDDVHQHIEDAVERAGVSEVIQEALVSLVFSALITPNGRLRRHLIEAVPAAGLVGPVTKVLVEVHRKLDDLSLRETSLFLLSRLREPTPGVINLISAAARQEEDPHLAQTALWAIGDTYVRPGGGRRASELNDFPQLLQDTATRVTTSPGDLTGKRVRMASAHALAILAAMLPQGDGSAQAVARALSAICDITQEDAVRRLAQWGQTRLDKKPALVDPVSLDVLERLEPGRAD